MYKTIVMFRDMQDGGHMYLPGDPFPRNGIMVNPERIAELASDANRRGCPLIAETEEKRPTRKRVKKDD